MGRQIPAIGMTLESNASNSSSLFCRIFLYRFSSSYCATLFTRLTTMAFSWSCCLDDCSLSLSLSLSLSVSLSALPSHGWLVLRSWLDTCHPLTHSPIRSFARVVMAWLVWVLRVFGAPGPCAPSFGGVATKYFFIRVGLGYISIYILLVLYF